MPPPVALVGYTIYRKNLPMVILNPGLRVFSAYSMEIKIRAYAPDLQVANYGPSS
jgi:hypothetical protein